VPEALIRGMNTISIYVSRKDDVARMDELVGAQGLSRGSAEPPRRQTGVPISDSSDSGGPRA
jgi:hypothetical protein